MFFRTESFYGFKRATFLQVLVLDLSRIRFKNDPEGDGSIYKLVWCASVLAESHVTCINFPVVLEQFDWYFLEASSGLVENYGTTKQGKKYPKVENCAFSKQDPLPVEGFQMQPGTWVFLC